MTASLPTNQKEGDADRNSLFIVKDRGGLASANQSRAALADARSSLCGRIQHTLFI